jgi:hypothetical protein
MSAPEHTPGPWPVGDYSEHLGYDCMTGGIRVGLVILDGADYGQKRCVPIEPEALGRMKADARLIAAAPDMLDSLKAMTRLVEAVRRTMILGKTQQQRFERALEVIARAEAAR